MEIDAAEIRKIIREELRRARRLNTVGKCYTQEEAAEILGVSPRTVNTLMASEELRSVKFRRCRRIPADALQDFINENQR